VSGNAPSLLGSLHLARLSDTRPCPRVCFVAARVELPDKDYLRERCHTGTQAARRRQRTRQACLSLLHHWTGLITLTALFSRASSAQKLRSAARSCSLPAPLRPRPSPPAAVPPAQRPPARGGERRSAPWRGRGGPLQRRDSRARPGSGVLLALQQEGRPLQQWPPARAAAGPCGAAPRWAARRAGG
jgi:hypothetical protein